MNSEMECKPLSSSSPLSQGHGMLNRPKTESRGGTTGCILPHGSWRGWWRLP